MSVKYYKDGELVDVSDMLIKTAGGGGEYNKVECTAAEYEAIDPHDNKTIYIVTQPDGSIVKYLGDEEIGYDKNYTIERAAIITEEDAETMVIEHEVIDVDVVSGTTAIYGNASNKFIADGKRVVMASTDAQMAASLTREDIYGAGTTYKTNASGALKTIDSITINSITLVTNAGSVVKRYSINTHTYVYSSYNVDIPAENVLTTFGCAFRVQSLNQTQKICSGVLGLAAIDNEGNKYFIHSGNSYESFNVFMSDAEMDFALGMTERYEVVEP